MKFLLLLYLLAAVSAAPNSPVVHVPHEGDEEYGAAVFLLNKVLTNLSATKEGPSFEVVTVQSVKIEVLTAYPTFTVDLKDKEQKVQNCDVTIFKPLDIEDFTSECDVIFKCPTATLERHVVL